MCRVFVTHPYSLHLGPEGIQQLKQDQTQRVNVHFVRVRVSRELRGQKGKICNMRCKVSKRQETKFSFFFCCLFSFSD